MLLTQKFSFNNGDEAIIEQKYCDIYNLSVAYRLQDTNKTSFQNGLDNIDQLAHLAQQDYKLKAPLKRVVDMLMNQQKLSLDRSFDIALPDQVVSSNESVEHNIAFQLEDGLATLNFYFGLGGE